MNVSGEQPGMVDGVASREWFVVVHEYPMENSRGDKRTDYGIASSVHERMETADNQLAYCQAMQRSEQPGSQGRYFVARLTEVTE